MVPLDGLFATVAIKLWARTGRWPDWFIWVIGNRVPAPYVRRGQQVRRELEREFRMRLPARPEKSSMEQLSLIPGPRTDAALPVPPGE